MGMLGELPPGLAGFAAQRQMAGQQQNQQLNQMQGMLGLQQAMAQQQETQQTQQLKGLLGQKLQSGDMEGAKGILMQMKPELFAQSLVPKAPEYKDLGGSIGIIQDGKLIGSIPKSATPDATLRETGESTRHATPSGSSVLGAETTRRGQDMTHALGRANLGVSQANLGLSRERFQYEQGQGGKAPTGYRFTPQNTLEAIPGGPADIKAGAEGAKAEMRQQVLSDQADNVISTIGQAKNLVGWTTAGAGGVLANLPMTDARTLAGHVETIKSNLGFDRLQQMRDMSPTGGALGQVAVQELNALRSTVASLDQLQKPSDVAKALDKIEKHYTKWKETLGGAKPPGAPPAAGTVKDGYRFKGGNPADKNNWEKVNG